MKKVFLLLFIVVCFKSVGQTLDSLTIVNNHLIALEQQNDSLQTELYVLSQQITDLEALISSISNNYSQTEKRVNLLEKQNNTLLNKLNLSEKSLTDSLSNLKNQIASNTENINLLGDRLDDQYGGLNTQLHQTKTTIKTNEDKHHKSAVWGIVIALIIVVALISIFFILRRRIIRKGNDIEQLRIRADELNHQIIERLDKELEEITKSISQASTTTVSTDMEPDHSLVKALADRITFMEMTLYRMDPAIKGHKHLTRSIKQMKDNLLANGYEIVDMLGKDYVEGMKVSPSFNDDETLENGKRIITGITKPQINYKGQMIQAAQITVSQNI